MPLAVSSIVSVLAVIGLVVGLVVLGVVISLLQGVLSPLRAILGDLQSAETAPMLARGVPGTDQLGTTRRLAESVPDLALRYLQKLSSAPAAPPSAMQTQARGPGLPAWKEPGR